MPVELQERVHEEVESTEEKRCREPFLGPNRQTVPDTFSRSFLAPLDGTHQQARNQRSSADVTSV
ncbi:hypothetical protein LCGC14_1691770 [marine sediment metagenome]|uniref:Uncharacterized protein n=1 Tax=marine sediment metagenome TaxID=412755 RepID=A0A0F9I877_9ZZZZ